MRDIIVTGGRDFDDYALLEEILEAFNTAVIIQGGATGADALARKYADTMGIRCYTEKAEWDKYKRAAGPIRNGVMLDSYPDAIIVAFPGGNGTEDCIAQALAKGRIVLRVER